MRLKICDIKTTTTIIYQLKNWPDNNKITDLIVLYLNKKQSSKKTFECDKY